MKKLSLSGFVDLIRMYEFYNDCLWASVTGCKWGIKGQRSLGAQRVYEGVMSGISADYMKNPADLSVHLGSRGWDLKSDAQCTR